MKTFPCFLQSLTLIEVSPSVLATSQRTQQVKSDHLGKAPRINHTKRLIAARKHTRVGYIEYHGAGSSYNTAAYYLRHWQSGKDVGSRCSIAYLINGSSISTGCCKHFLYTYISDHILAYRDNNTSQRLFPTLDQNQRARSTIADFNANGRVSTRSNRFH